MKKYFKRFLTSLGALIGRLFNVGIPLKIVLLLVVLVGGLCVGLTYSKMMKKVGGKADFEEAMRYIEIKDAVSDNYIDAADRDKMGQSAAAAMVSGLGDKWSYYMSPDEYRSYKLRTSIPASACRSPRKRTAISASSPSTQAPLRRRRASRPA